MARALLENILRFLSAAQVQAAIIAGVVSLVVSWFTNRRNRRAQKVQEAKTLLGEVYNPFETAFLHNRSLYSVVTQNKGIFTKNRRRFSNKIRPLIDEALRNHHSEGIGLQVEFTLLEKESIAKLKDIEARLYPLVVDEVNRLQKLVDDE